MTNVSSGEARARNDDSYEYAAKRRSDARHLVCFTRSGELMIQDVQSLERRVVKGVLPGVPDVINRIALAPDGRTLYHAARQVEANIGMVERASVAKTR